MIPFLNKLAVSLFTQQTMLLATFAARLILFLLPTTSYKPATDELLIRQYPVCIVVKGFIPSQVYEFAFIFV